MGLLDAEQMTSEDEEIYFSVALELLKQNLKFLQYNEDVIKMRISQKSNKSKF
jgi:hypothetical protein